MREKEIREHFTELISYGSELYGNKSLVDELLEKHINRIPNKKLYKYRTCAKRNIDILAENCIWVSPASSFKDQFDCTLNIDLKQNAKQIKIWIEENIAVYTYAIIKTIFLNHGKDVPLSFSDYEEAVKTCVAKDGTFMENKYREFACKHFSEDELKNYNEVIAIFPVLKQRVEALLDASIEPLLDGIGKQRIQTRERTLVYSMADSYDNKSLWENYSNDYTGFCIEYSFGNFKEAPYNVYKNLLHVIPMIYCKKKPIFNIVPIIDGCIKEQIYGDESYKKDTYIAIEINTQLYYKNKEYDFEHEWRLSLTNNSLYKQPFPFVSGIYVGKDIKPRNFSRLKNIAKQLGVPIYKQTLNSSNNGYDYIVIE